MNKFTLIIDGETHRLPVSKQFSGGEVHVNVNHLPNTCKHYFLKTKLGDGNDIMQMLCYAEALRKRFPKATASVLIPYMPYGRQDRACAEGDSHSLYVFASTVLSFLDKMCYTIYTLDMHSQAGIDTINSYMMHTELVNIEQHKIIKEKCIDVSNLLSKGVILVSPDKGATEKTKKVASLYGNNIVQGHKKRNPTTGQLSGFGIDTDNLNGKDVLIVDDICDGGGTFIGLAEEMRKANAGSIGLFVTHGIFSKGFDIFEGIIDNIYTTNSFNRIIKPEVSRGFVTNSTKLHTYFY